tara:strand:- start:13238 stop:13567 length:330 start_codon:yes stop_codon:yes gene_type:complete
MLDLTERNVIFVGMSDNQKQQTDWQKREIGALWKRESPNQKYFSGHVTDPDGNRTKVLIFTNKSKQKDNQPDFRVYKADDQPQQSRESATAAVASEEVVDDTQMVDDVL